MPTEGLIRVRCLSNAEYLTFDRQSSRLTESFFHLVVNDFYWAKPDLEHGMWRVWDLSGQDYLYPERYFERAAD